MPRLLRTTPVLASLDIDHTVSFYETKLGFEKLYARAGEYAVLSRDGVSVHFWACDDPKIAAATSCRIMVDDVDALYAELLDEEVMHPNGKLENKPWGAREFPIVDGDGNLITFYEVVDGGSQAQGDE